MPALLIRMSMRPNSPRVRSTIRARSARTVTSVGTAAERRPSAFTSPTVRSAPALSSSATTTSAPSFASSRAVARPMPRPPPVTIATCPLSSMVTLPPRSGERHGGGEPRHGAVHPCGVALARRVLDQARVAGAEDVLRAVAEPDLELAAQDDDELPPRRRMPVDEPTHGILAEADLRRRQPLHPVRVLAEVDRLDVRLPVGARVESK